ncbi:MAG: hypothetical protein VX346_15875 [Planctomycetota bacterium]|nr:hypothetical protein [Planctomycetota bacterium]
MTQQTTTSHSPRISRCIISTSRVRAVPRHVALTCLAVASLAALPTLSLGGEPEDFANFYSWYRGKWQIVKEQEGKKETIKGRCDGTPVGSNVWISDAQTSLWGYDPRTKLWTGVGQLKDGARFVRVITRPPAATMKAGVKFTFKGTIWHADGKVTYETVEFTCVDDNTSQSVITAIDQDGKPLPRIVTRATRIK